MHACSTSDCRPSKSKISVEKRRLPDRDVVFIDRSVLALVTSLSLLTAREALIATQRGLSEDVRADRILVGIASAGGILKRVLLMKPQEERSIKFSLKFSLVRISSIASLAPDSAIWRCEVHAWTKPHKSRI